MPGSWKTRRLFWHFKVGEHTWGCAVDGCASCPGATCTMQPELSSRSTMLFTNTSALATRNTA